MTSTHVSSRDVELLYLGCGSEAAATHAAHCQPCAEELSAFRRQRDALLERWRPEEYARRLAGEHASIVRTRRWLKRVSGGLALAAGVLGLMLRGGLDEAQPNRGIDGEVARSLELRPAEAAPGDFVPKGDSAFGVVRKRGTEIDVLSGVLTVQPGDALRIRFVGRASGRTVAGVMTDDGGWLPLFDEDFPAGAHTPEATLRVTQTPGAGVIVLGTPEAVAAARAGEPADVERARLIWTPAAARRGDERPNGPTTEMDPRDAIGR